MADWIQFSDPRLALQFRYPHRALNGEPVDRVESYGEGRLRVHVLAPRSRQVYFEVTRYETLTPEAAYEIHREALKKQFASVLVTELRESISLSLPVREYRITWDSGTRSVLLFPRGQATYRIIHNPLFAVNFEILSTVEWRPFT